MVKSQMPEDNKGTTYSFDVCSQCKSICCQDAKPPLTENRKKIIKEYLKEQKINIEKPFAKEKYSYPDVDELVFCKPETCVAGPVTFDINFSTKKVEWFLKKSELCAFAGILYNDKAAFKQHLEAAKKELTELICQLNADELGAIVRIAEPQTFKVDEDDLPLEVKEKLGLAEA
jgi:hypothetical protein